MTFKQNTTSLSPAHHIQARHCVAIGHSPLRLVQDGG